jgi:hypothetical protein
MSILHSYPSSFVGKSMAFHILANQQNVVGWQLVLNYMRTHVTHYYLESSGQVTYIETHP